MVSCSILSQKYRHHQKTSRKEVNLYANEHAAVENPRFWIGVVIVEFILTAVLTPEV
jgi:hypothetical protein